MLVEWMIYIVIATLFILVRYRQLQAKLSLNNWFVRHWAHYQEKFSQSSPSLRNIKTAFMVALALFIGSWGVPN